MEKSKSSLVTILIIVAVVVVAGIYAFRSYEAAQPGPDISRIGGSGEGVSVYTDLGGNPVDLSIYEGKTLVVNAWASWCPFCVNELPDLARIAREYQDQDVVVIAINRKESGPRAEAFLKTVSDVEGLVFLLDPDDTFYKSIGGNTMPETVFYDREGNISLHKRGFMRIDEIQGHVETALTKPNN